jgi:DNA-binding SARP family transcriptional activator
MITPTLRVHPHFHLSLIRGFELRLEDRVVNVARSAQRLVAFVALQDRAVQRLHASGVLWTDMSERQANTCLRSALWRTPAVTGQHLVQASGTHLWLDPSVEVDFHEVVNRAISLVEGDSEGSGPQELFGELGLFSSDLLPGWYEDWVLAEQERFRQLRLHALEAICERLTDAGRYALAIEAGLAAVACEPLRESAQRQVIRAHLAEGNATEALRQYRRYAKLLTEELGAQPSPALSRMLERETRAIATSDLASSHSDL